MTAANTPRTQSPAVDRPSSCRGRGKLMHEWTCTVQTRAQGSVELFYCLPR